MSPNPFRKSSNKAVNTAPVVIQLDPEFENAHTATVAPSEWSSPQGWKRNQYLASLAANFGAIELGTMFSWCGTALPYLREDPRGIITDITQESWIGSIIIIGALISGPVSGYCNERIGRRLTMLILTIPSLLGWALIYFAQNVEMVLAGRFLLGLLIPRDFALILGLAAGAFAVVAPIYVAETADPDIRGKLSVGFDMGIAVGILYVEVVGAYSDWQWQTIASSILTVIGHLLLVIVPETPRYLLSKGRVDDAKKSLCWLKNTTDYEIVKRELNELQEALAEQKKDESSRSTNSWTVLLQPHVLKPLLCSLFLHLASAMTGITPIDSYIVDIFISAGTHIDEFLSTVIFGSMGALASVVSALVVDKFGRRPLLIISQVLMTVSLTAMGIFFFLKRNNNDQAPDGLDWLPITSLGIFIFAFAFGTGPLAYTIQGKILPPEAKGVGASIITTVKWVACFVTTRFFFDIMSTLGEDGGYWLFAGFSLLGTVYVTFWIPETKGKTLEEIQRVYLVKN